MSPDLIQDLCMVLEEFPIVALATIVQTWGSTPRKAGAKMVICPDGRTFGTIGGGCSEGEVKTRARIVMDTQKAEICKLSLVGDVVADEGMVCGGKMDVFIEPVFSTELM